MRESISALSPSERLLCGPGPTNVEPAALAAMGKPMLGHLDPELHVILHEVAAMLSEVYRATDGVALPLQSTGTSGMEAGIANLVEPDDTVIVGVSGYFGARIAEIARRHGARVVEVAEEWGRHVPNERIAEALARNLDARLVAVVHGETSTGVEHPLSELAPLLADTDALLMADCVTTLGGVPLDFDGWGIDYAYSCTQKCLGAPPGMSPVALSQRALERIRNRSTPVPFSLDLSMLIAYWIDRPAAYHHTAPILNIYALHEVLRGTLEEGVQERWARHESAGRRLAARAEEAGFEVLAEPRHRLAPLTAVRVPDGVDGKQVQMQLLAEYGMEVGGGLGTATPPIWRIGLMGPNATDATADRVLDTLTGVLDGGRVPVAG
ncbi:MAG: alanine-glyoxylate transaminase / serine-glyoxylate transaminase / serine-pyruvate transaminase [Thermoleophilaceae bacterium]|nr:alanine-glyoxylate transaminase / serine-glyoxylate transaminase / serine-pyruvate transaminase [Thermoleophilaceae bacterium]